jgi:hypothetical protein
MSYLHRIAPAAAWLALSAVASLAHATNYTRSPSNAADADASVLATTYQTPLMFRQAGSDTSTPAQNWKTLNKQVDSYDSMALTMGNASVPQPEAMTPKTGGAPIATPAAPPNHLPAAAPAPDPHAHHMKEDAR